ESEEESFALVTAPTAQGQAPSKMAWQQGIDYCNGLTIGGHSDWQLATVDERRMEFRAYKPITNTNEAGHGATDKVDPPLGNYSASDPARTSLVEFQSGGSEAFSADNYSSATESSNNVVGVFFADGNEGNFSKTFVAYARAVRRAYF
ncbi:MAG: hypothetical protein VX449_01425, partial [Pseudomonadota bacterium]|nr:hypothetical protein [Pseudomonadota bacterium]